MSIPTFDIALQEKVSQAEELISRVVSESPRPCVTCSFQAEDMVAVDLIRQFIPEVPVLFLDTGYHFAEVYEYRDALASAWRLNLVNLKPPQSVADQERAFGLLYQTAPDQCCGARKVKPLFTALERYTAWFTGLRREQSRSRAELRELEVFTLPTATALQKISPLTTWSTREVWSYATAKNIPLLKLYEKGYSSIGCEPCTALPSDPGDPRSGRWSGRKLECGIHIQPAK